MGRILALFREDTATAITRVLASGGHLLAQTKSLLKVQNYLVAVLELHADGGVVKRSMAVYELYPQGTM